MVQLTDNHWAVEVPDDSFAFRIDGHVEDQILSCLLKELSENKQWNKVYTTPLPPGTWQYLFTTKGCSEEDARKVDGLQHHNFKEWYLNFEKRKRNYFTAALPSLESLLRSKGCDTNKNWAIIQKLSENGTEKNV